MGFTLDQSARNIELSPHFLNAEALVVHSQCDNVLVPCGERGNSLLARIERDMLYFGVLRNARAFSNYRLDLTAFIR